MGNSPPITFSDALQGLKWAKEHDFDLLIVDSMMPGLDSVAFIEQLRAMPDKANWPILMILANDQKQIRYRALERASEHIKASAGIHFDPQCVEAFFANWAAVLEIRQRFADEASA